MLIVPALLEKNPDTLLLQIQQVSPYFHHFQIDIADGIFVQNKTAQIEDIPQLPNQITYDFHLMVKDYDAEIKKLLRFRNSKTVFIHFGVNPDIEILKKKYNLSFALVLNPEDSVDQLSKTYDLKEISSIQIMSINPGFQGSPFLPETLKKIEELRQKGFTSTVYMDGGINKDTLPLILRQRYTPDILVIGSFLTKSENLQNAIDYLKEVLTK